MLVGLVFTRVSNKKGPGKKKTTGSKWCAERLKRVRDESKHKQNEIFVWAVPDTKINRRQKIKSVPTVLGE